MKKTTRFAEYLLDEMAYIDDRFVAEAETEYLPAPVRRTFRPRYAVVLAAVLALLSFPVISLSIALQGAKSSDMEHNPGDAGIHDAEDVLNSYNQSMEDSVGGTVMAPSLSRALSDLRDETEALRLPQEELALTEGASYVIWQYSDEPDYRVLSLTAEEETLLLSVLRSEPPLAPIALPEVRLWLVLADGNVLTPYSRQTGTDLFDYEPVTEPPSEFVSALLSVLS